VEPTLQSTPYGAEVRGGRGGVGRSDCPTVASTALVRATDQVGDLRTRSATRGDPAVLPRQSNVEPQLGARGRRDRTTEALRAAIRDAVMRTGASATRGASIAADLLVHHCWSTNTCDTRSSQWRKWERFCEHDDLSVFPASEGDVLAYVGFLRLEGSVSAASLPHCRSACPRSRVTMRLQE
jgi:hypothetical protein